MDVEKMASTVQKTCVDLYTNLNTQLEKSTAVMNRFEQIYE